jgi:N-methylhydantoinase A/oxoprolinase/acetone carboxylase beta subunit
MSNFDVFIRVGFVSILVNSAYMYTLAIDIGGTFTDLALVNESDGSISLHKVLTTPQNPAEGSIQGIEEILSENDVGLEEVETIIHATTLVSNTLIEKTGATTGLLTTAGARDTLKVRRGYRYDIYDWELEYPDPLVPRPRRTEIDERLDESGDVLTLLSEQSVREKVIRLVEDHDVEAIAISLLHSYVNDEHERRIKEIVESEFPSVYVSTSSEIVPVIREYERTSTTVINAYVGPVVTNYLEFLRSELHAIGFGGELFMMTSAGGIVDIDTAKQEPSRIIESGPTAGAQLNKEIHARESLTEDALSFDMGGTTAKGLVIQEEQLPITYQKDVARQHRFKEGSGYDVITPMVDLTEIGAGGGSIAHIDEMGFVDVGPESSGADPGPICYDNGGEKPTVTDAALSLGFLDASNFFGGDMELMTDTVEDIVQSDLSDPLNASIEDVSWRIYEAVCENMAIAFRRYISDRGIDPGTLSTIAIGGAGPMHANRVAKKLGIEEIICPFGSGVGSSIGLVQAPKSYTASRTERFVLDSDSTTTLESVFTAIYDEAERTLKQAGADQSELLPQFVMDMRYVEQGHELHVPLESDSIEDISPESAKQRFEEYQQDVYDREPMDYPVEVLTCRVTLSEQDREGGLGGSSDASAEGPTDESEQLATGRRDVYFGDEGWIPATIYDWSLLQPGTHIDGPSIIEADFSTVVVESDASAEMNDHRSIVIRTGVDDS